MSFYTDTLSGFARSIPGMIADRQTLIDANASRYPTYTTQVGTETGSVTVGPITAAVWQQYVLDPFNAWAGELVALQSAIGAEIQRVQAGGTPDNVEYFRPRWPPLWPGLAQLAKVSSGMLDAPAVAPTPYSGGVTVSPSGVQAPIQVPETTYATDPVYAGPVSTGGEAPAASPDDLAAPLNFRTAAPSIDASPTVPMLDPPRVSSSAQQVSNAAPVTSGAPVVPMLSPAAVVGLIALLVLAGLAMRRRER